MVFPATNWDSFVKYAEVCRVGFYRVEQAIDDKKEIRVMAGRLGFKSQYKEGDKKLEKIVEYCRQREFIEIGEHIPDEIFFGRALA